MKVSSDIAALWIFAYDICSDSSREKVANLLADYGVRVQRSVFECLLDRKQAGNLLSLLEQHVTPQDSIIAFPLCASCLKKYTSLGKEQWFDWNKNFLLIDF